MKKAHKKTIEHVREDVRHAAVGKTVRRSRAFEFRVGLTLVVVAFIALAFFARMIAYFPIDLQITHQIQRIHDPYFAAFAQAISYIGFSPQSNILVASVAIALFVIGLRWEGVMAAVTGISVTIVNIYLKTLVHRPRPGEGLVHVFAHLGEYSFPSGHVMFYTAFFGYLIFITYTILKKKNLRRALIVLFSLMILLIAPSRIYLGQHWASDTLGAYMAGSIWLTVIIYVYEWGKRHIFPRQPVVSEHVPTG